MKISQLLENQDQQLDELDLGKAWQTAKNIGQGVKDTAVGVARGVGDVGSALAGGAASTLGAAYGGLKRGYSLGAYHTPPRTPERDKDDRDRRDNVSAVDQIIPPQTTQIATPQIQEPPQATAQAPTPPPATTPPTQATAQPTQASTQIPRPIDVGQLNKIIPTLRTRDLQSLKKTLDATLMSRTRQPATTRRSSPTAASTKPAVSQSAAAARPVAEHVEFYSKFLEKKI